MVTKPLNLLSVSPLASNFQLQEKSTESELRGADGVQGLTLLSANTVLVHLLTNKVKLLNLDEIANPCEATDGEIITKWLVHKTHHR